MDIKTIVMTLMSLSIGTVLFADVEPANIFQDRMVLQRDMKVPVWGKAAPGELVSVEFAGQRKSTQTAENGKWMLSLDPLKASAEPAEMKIRGKNEIILKDVLVGEVWIACGQSNMGFQLEGCNNAKEEIAAANYPQIRGVTLKTKWSKQPIDTFDGKWELCSPETAGKFSGAAYFFARELHKRLGVPVGIVQNAWGGTPAESWTPIEKLRAKPELYASFLSLYDKFAPLSEEEIARLRFEAEKEQRQKDPGNVGEAKGWAKPEADLSGWKDIKVPGYLESVYGETDGAYWYRRDVEIPVSWANSELTLELGAIDDLDTSYFNGEKIGATGFEVSEWWDVRRVYKVPAKLVKPGKNTIAVRVFDERYAGGFSGPEITLVKQGETPIDLKGVWKINEELRMKPLPAPKFQYLPHMPSYLYNGMIAPVVPLAMRGVIWYQGENNAGRFVEYRTLFKDMILGWREKWGQGDFPFYFVQLANYMARKEQPSESNWAGLREAQAMALSLPKTGMAVAVEIGDAKDIHPKNKQDVGLRLALNALAQDYGQKLEFSGPVYKSMSVEDGKIRLKFTHADALKAKGEKLKGFAICGADKNFVWADAKIDGADVLVWSDSVKEPVAVRYAWADNPECNLYNGADLPAAPFRTDEFELSDSKKK